MSSLLPFVATPAESRPFSLTDQRICEPPLWVWQLPGISDDGQASDDWRTQGVLCTRVLDHALYGLISITIPNARALDHDDFSQAAEAAYGMVLDTVPTLQARFPIRMWNVIPGILEPLGDLDQRYKVFNQSRYRAFRKRSDNPFETYLPTATGVGNVHSSDTLTIHCLTADAPGSPMENPRQVPAYRYSERFGPRPPCFSRATSVSLHNLAFPPQPTLLIGGTASVRGEDSHHCDDLLAQLDETELNLRALAALITGSRTDWGGHFEHLRVYHRRPEDRESVERFVSSTFPSTGAIEFFSVNICREELLVEIEGIFRPAG